MKRCVIVTEGAIDEAILRSVLGVKRSDPEVDVVAAGGWSAADSLARSYLIIGRSDVALVVDADTTDPSAAEDRRRFFERSLSEVGPRARRAVVVIEPTIVALLFEDPGVVAALAGRQIPPRAVAHPPANPKDALMRSLGEELSALELEERLAHVDLSAARSHPEVRRLTEFVVAARSAIAVA